MQLDSFQSWEPFLVYVNVFMYLSSARLQAPSKLFLILHFPQQCLARLQSQFFPHGWLISLDKLATTFMKISAHVSCRICSSLWANEAEAEKNDDSRPLRICMIRIQEFCMLGPRILLANLSSAKKAIARTHLQIQVFHVWQENCNPQQLLAMMDRMLYQRNHVAGLCAQLIKYLSNSFYSNDFTKCILITPNLLAVRGSESPWMQRHILHCLK